MGRRIRFLKNVHTRDLNPIPSDWKRPAVTNPHGTRMMKIQETLSPYAISGLRTDVASVYVNTVTMMSAAKNTMTKTTAMIAVMEEIANL